MNYQDLRNALHQEPFEPFRMILTDGTVYEVRHPELVWVGRRVCLVGSAAEDAPVFDRFDTVALIHIVRLEPLRSQATVGSN